MRKEPKIAHQEQPADLPLMTEKVDSTNKFWSQVSRIISTLWFRISLGVAVPLFVFAGGYFIFYNKNPFFCVFHSVTGLYCPGCGTGRAINCILHLDLLGAFDYNLLMVIFLPIILFYGIKQYLFIVFKGVVLPMGTMKISVYNYIMIGIILYTIIRNIPVYPLSLLAP